MTWEIWRLPYQICPRSPWGQHPAQKFPQESKPKFHLPPFFLFWPRQAAQTRTRMQPLPCPATSPLHLPRSHSPTGSRGKG